MTRHDMEKLYYCISVYLRTRGLKGSECRREENDDDLSLCAFWEGLLQQKKQVRGFVVVVGVVATQKVVVVVRDDVKRGPKCS